MKQAIYNLEAKKVGDLEFGVGLDDIEINHDLIYQVMITLLAHRRKTTAHTKIRSEVRGGGRKPWKQKGTGHARAGSIRSPIFRGGGVTFGPRNDVNFKKKINKKVRKQVFKMVFAGKLKDNELKIFKEFKLEKPSTKKMADLFNKIKVDGKSVLLVSNDKNENLKKSLKNIQKVNVKLAVDVNSLDLLNHKFLFLDEKAAVYYKEKCAMQDSRKALKSKPVNKVKKLS